MRRMRLWAMIALAAAVAFAFAAPAAHAQSLSDADRGAIRDTIREQVEAFRADDGERAFSYATPMLRQMFGTAEIFMDMVRQGYRPVYRPQTFDFRALVVMGDHIAQRVHVVGADGRAVSALYVMEKQPDGTWRIAGCYLDKPDDLGA
jgi:ketosteroid isomerase-like protein